MPNRISPIKSLRKSPKRSPKRSSKRSLKRSLKRLPKRLPKRSPRRMSKNLNTEKISIMDLRHHKGGNPIRVPFIPLNLSISNLQAKINRLFRMLPISSETRKNISDKIDKYEELIKNLIKEYDKYKEDKYTVGVKATGCYKIDSQLCIDNSCDVSKCNNRYSFYLNELTGIKRCFDHWKITGYITLMKIISDYSHYYYQRKVASTIMGPQERKDFDDHSWDETIAIQINNILVTIAQKIVTKLKKPNISKIGRKIHRERARKARQAKIYRERIHSKTISKKRRSKVSGSKIIDNKKRSKKKSKKKI